jgi:hypothetical protein
MLDQTKIMANKQKGQSKLGLKNVQQVRNLGWDGDV